MPAWLLKTPYATVLSRPAWKFHLLHSWSGFTFYAAVLSPMAPPEGLISASAAAIWFLIPCLLYLPAMPTHTEHLITLILAPVVLISACGLLALTFYNRLAVLTARIRSFNAERFELMEKIHHEPAGNPHDIQMKDSLLARQKGLEEQTHAILYRARLIRGTLVCLVCCIIGMLLCSLSLGLELVLPRSDIAALVFFILGMLAMLLAMITALMELRLSLKPVSLEQAFFHEISPFEDPLHSSDA